MSASTTKPNGKADIEGLFQQAAMRAAAYRTALPGQGIRPVASVEDIAKGFDLPTPETGAHGSDIIQQLADAAEPGLMAMASPRFFGWVIGGSHPVGVAADMMTSAWGQNSCMSYATPAAAYAEKTAAGWLLDLLDLPREASVGFVTGATMANFVCLAAARTRMYKKIGWDIDEQGFIGAPAIRALIGEDAHASVYSALQYLGFGRASATRVATDAQGRMIATALKAELAASDSPAIVICQAGQINTGAIDPFEDIVPICRKFGAHLHVDGAFGLWARACRDRAHLAVGIDGADSWATDGHKWLQLPYESGFAIVRDEAAHRAAMSICASYLINEDKPYNPKDYVPELSRRARGFPAWAVIRALGREGIDEMISRHCCLARQLANRLRREPGIAVLNAVNLNQLIVDFDIDGPDRARDVRAIVRRINERNHVLVETAEWRRRLILRVSITSGETRREDIQVLEREIVEAWRKSSHHPQQTSNTTPSPEPQHVTA
ncbi:MAG: aminotransferase class V-fold PLP-dependent enzyme [Hyphomonadaceae bacterium]|nr:aminotransferase class V-fold PLP-dependent enzyme [Hyphomonadaceae bacterium]